MQPQAGNAARHPVEDPRERAPGERVAAMGLPAGDEVEALVELRKQPRNLGRVVLQVGVDGYDDVAFRVLEPCRERCCLAEVAPQPDDAHVRLSAVEARQRGERAVGRAVVDEHGFPWLAERLQG